MSTLTPARKQFIDLNLGAHFYRVGDVVNDRVRILIKLPHLQVAFWNAFRGDRGDYLKPVVVNAMVLNCAGVFENIPNDQEVVLVE